VTGSRSKGVDMPDTHIPTEPGAQAPDEVAGEILPGIEVLKRDIDALAPDDAAAATQIVTRIGWARFSAIEEDNLLAALKARTGANMNTLRAALKEAKRRAGGGRKAVTGWQAQLITNEQDEPRPIMANAALAVTHHPAFFGVLGFDE